MAEHSPITDHPNYVKGLLAAADQAEGWDVEKHGSCVALWESCGFV